MRPIADSEGKGDNSPGFYLWWSELMKKPWFGVKAYGIGIGPISLPGWLSILAYAAAMVGVSTLGGWLSPPPPSWIVGAIMLALTVGLFVLIGLKSDGKPWRWRWGGR